VNNHSAGEPRETSRRIAIVAGFVEHMKPHVGPLRGLGEGEHPRRLGIAAKTFGPQQHGLGAIRPREVGDQVFQNRHLAIERGASDVQRLDLRQASRLLDAAWNSRGRGQVRGGDETRMCSRYRFQEIVTIGQKAIADEPAVDQDAGQIARLQRLREQVGGGRLQPPQSARRQMLIIEDDDEDTGRGLSADDDERQYRSDRGQPCRHDRMLFCLAAGSHEELR